MRYADTTFFALAASLPATTAQDNPCQGYQTNPSDVAACADELTFRGSETCSVVGGFTKVFCQIGDAQIVGVGNTNPSGIEVSTPCINVAITVGKILDACTREVSPYGLRVGGNMPANGNRNMTVHAVLNQ